MIEGRKPMVLTLHSGEVDRVSVTLQAEGWETKLPLQYDWESYRLNGYERVAYPGTRRWIQVPGNSASGATAFHYLIKRKKPEAEFS